MYKIIFIDDEPLLLDMLCFAIDWQKYGFEIDASFTDSTEALEYIRTHHVDAVLSDIKMPGLNGIDLAEICHREQADTIFVLISAFSEFQYAQRALKYGVFAYLTKPFVYDDFVSLAQNIFKKLKQRKAKHNTFLDSAARIQFKKIFIDLLYRDHAGTENYKSILRDYSIDINLDSIQCAIVSVSLENFNTYISSTWKYGIQRFYNAINLIVPFETSSYYSSVLKCDDNVISAVVALKSSEKDLDSAVTAFISELHSSLSDVLNIQSTINVLARLKSITDVINFCGHENAKYDDIISNAIEYINRNFHHPIKINDIAQYVHISEMYFCSCFKKQTGKSVINYITNLRMKKAEEFLQNSSNKAANLHFLVGYDSKSHFYKIFKRYHNGLTPMEYQKLYE